MLSSLRRLYWRLRYRPGRTLTFCYGFDGFREILVVENRVSSTGTLVYRQRTLNTMARGVKQSDFGPEREDTVPEMVRRLRSFGAD